MKAWAVYLPTWCRSLVSLHLGWTPLDSSQSEDPRCPTDTDLRIKTSSTNTCRQRTLLPRCLLITWPLSFFNNGEKRLSPPTSEMRVEALPKDGWCSAHIRQNVCLCFHFKGSVIRFTSSSRHPGDSFTGWRLFIGICLLAFQARCGDRQGAAPVPCVFTLIP